MAKHLSVKARCQWILRISHRTHSIIYTTSFINRKTGQPKAILIAILLFTVIQDKFMGDLDQVATLQVHSQMEVKVWCLIIHLLGAVFFPIYTWQLRQMARQLWSLEQNKHHNKLMLPKDLSRRLSNTSWLRVKNSKISRTGFNRGHQLHSNSKESLIMQNRWELAIAQAATLITLRILLRRIQSPGTQDYISKVYWVILRYLHHT